jgi:hypothetical protein
MYVSAAHPAAQSVEATKICETGASVRMQCVTKYDAKRQKNIRSTML